MLSAMYRGVNEKKYVHDVFLKNNDQLARQIIITETSVLLL